MLKITEGRMAFHGCHTWYRVAGEGRDGKKPLLLLHGGPGSTHNYMELFDTLAEEGRMVVSYDQIGCGLSPAPGRTDLFNRQVWLEELIALRAHLGLEEVHILGQSWGGMLLLEYVCTAHPAGLKSMVLSSTLPSSALWAREQHRMIRELPEDMREAIRLADETGNYAGDAYQRANDEYMLRHCAPVWTDRDPECLTRPKGDGREAYITAWGPNEFTPLGNLRDFDHTAELPGIRVPTLVTSGVNDLCTPLIAKTMADAIPGARWELFAASRHMAFAEEREAYMALMRSWLSEHD